jgi:phosphate transport system protein
MTAKTRDKAVVKKPHLDHVFDDDLAELRRLVGTMASKADGMLSSSLEALRRHDSDLAKVVVAADRELNALEVEIDERSLRMLARWQPAASDLRFVAAVLKLVTDLERVADHCVNICQRVLELSHVEPDAGIDLDTLATAVQTLLRDALGALRSEDVQAAAQVIERGQHTDGLLREVLHSCFASLRRPGSDVHFAIRMHEIATYLHRIAAHATNIAEMVIFLVRGEDVRHAGKLSAGRE